MNKVITTLIILLMSNHVFAEWEHYSSDSERNYYYDLNRVKIVNNDAKIISYWTKSIYFQDLKKDTITVGDYYLTQYFVNCSKSELAIKELHLYKKDGDLRDSLKKPYLEYSPYIPESRGEYLATSLCSTIFGS